MLDDLRRARAFSSVFDGAPFGVCRVELDGRIADANPTLTRLLGPDLTARVMTTEVTHPKDRALSCRLFDDLTSGRRETFSLDKRYLGAGGQAVMAHSTVVLVRDAEGRPDFTIGLIEPSGELAELRERATEAMTAAHDLNNLLTALFGHQELLLRALPPDDKLRAAVEAIGHVARMSVPIVQTILRTRTRRRESVDVNALILGMRSAAAQLVGSNVKIVLRLDPTIPPVVVERDLLERSIANIATNAHDAMPDGGTFVIETTSEAAFVKILVSDTGAGIQPGLRSRIFDRDFSTKPHGHGIGLALARDTVEAAGGFITVDSDFGQGSTFTLAFPRPPAAAESHSPDVPRHPRADHSGSATAPEKREPPA